MKCKNDNKKNNISELFSFFPPNHSESLSCKLIICKTVIKATHDKVKKKKKVIFAAAETV